MANRAAGKGYENEDHYTNIRLHFIGIENIHVMRNSQQKLTDGAELHHPPYTIITEIIFSCVVRSGALWVCGGVCVGV